MKDLGEANVILGMKISRTSNGIVRTSFGLDSKIGLDSGPTSPNNKFVERGRKN